MGLNQDLNQNMDRPQDGLSQLRMPSGFVDLTVERATNSFLLYASVQESLHAASKELLGCSALEAPNRQIKIHDVGLYCKLIDQAVERMSEQIGCLGIAPERLRIIASEVASAKLASICGAARYASSVVGRGKSAADIATVFRSILTGRERAELSPLLRYLLSEHTEVGAVVTFLYHDAVRSGLPGFSQAAAGTPVRAWFRDFLRQSARIFRFSEQVFDSFKQRAASEHGELRRFLDAFRYDLNLLLVDCVNMAATMAYLPPSKSLLYWPSFPWPAGVAKRSTKAAELVNQAKSTIPTWMKKARPELDNDDTFEGSYLPVVVPINISDLKFYMSYLENYLKGLSQAVSNRPLAKKRKGTPVFNFKDQWGAPWSILCRALPDHRQARIAIVPPRSHAGFVIRVDREGKDEFGERVTLDIGRISFEKAVEYSRLAPREGSGISWSYKAVDWADMVTEKGSARPRVNRSPLSDAEQASLMMAVCAQNGSMMALHQHRECSHHLHERLSSLFREISFERVVNQFTEMLRSYRVLNRT
jgi:hypothetical protein